MFNDVFISFAKSWPTDMDTLQRHATDDDTSAKAQYLWKLVIQFLEHMGNLPGKEIKDNYQCYAAFTLNSVDLQMAANKWIEEFNNTFTAVMNDMRSQSPEK